MDFLYSRGNGDLTGPRSMNSEALAYFMPRLIELAVEGATDRDGDHFSVFLSTHSASPLITMKGSHCLARAVGISVLGNCRNVRMHE